MLTVMVKKLKQKLYKREQTFIDQIQQAVDNIFNHKLRVIDYIELSKKDAKRLIDESNVEKPYIIHVIGAKFQVRISDIEESEIGYDDVFKVEFMKDMGKFKINLQDAANNKFEGKSLEELGVTYEIVPAYLVKQNHENK